MLNMNQFLVNAVADNIVVVNGAKFKVTDEVATKIMSLVLGAADVPVSQPATKVAVTKSETKPATKYVATKDFKPQYEVKKQTSTDGKALFCISRKNGWTRAEKACMNGAIKALKDIITIDVAFEKNGKASSFKAWGYKTKKQAEAMMATLPSVFTAEQLNSTL